MSDELEGGGAIGPMVNVKSTAAVEGPGIGQRERRDDD
jgi:hypothetical protein